MIAWLLIAVGVVLVVVIGFVAVGRETSLLASVARPAVLDLEEAVTFIGDRLPDEVSGRVSYDDVRWVLRADADLLEEATAVGPGAERRYVDEDDAIARILARAEGQGRDLEDGDVVAVLAGRLTYLEAVGAIGPEADSS